MKINEKNLIAYSITRDNIDKEGYLLKKGEVNKAFQRRWFVLKGNLLYYFEKKGDKDPIGVIILEGCTTELAESEEYHVFKLVFYGTNSRTYKLSAETQDELEAWMKYISRASYDYLKLMVAELQKQLEELEEVEDSSCARSVVPPISVCSLPASAFQKQRENPFNRNEEMSFSDLWKCNESLQSASSLLSKTSCATGPSLGSVRVNPSLPPSIPFRPAPPIPIIRAPSSRNASRKAFLILHREYGVEILKDRGTYTLCQLKSSYGNSFTDTKTENLIDI